MSRPPCPYCGTSSSAFEEENGVIICTFCGRQQEIGLQIADDDADFGTQGKITRKKTERKRVKVSKVLKGRAAYRAYLLAWQHVLWRVARVVAECEERSGDVGVGVDLKTRRRKEEFWGLVRDLWTVWLEVLVRRLEEGIGVEDEGAGGEGVEAMDGREGMSTLDGTTEDEDEVDVLRREGRRSVALTPKLWDTVSLVYFVLLLMRHPIALSKLFHLIRTEQMPYIRAIRYVPTELSSKLPPEYQLALDTTTIPEPYELQQAVYRLLQTFNKDFGMQVPALNWRILLFRWIEDLALPIEVYPAAKQLVGLTGLNMSYHFPGESTYSENRKTRKRRRNAVAMPELQLISLIVVATKMLFPFCTHHDSNPEATPSPMTSLQLNWDKWLDLHKDHAEHTPSSTTDPSQLAPIDTRDTDILDMTNDQLDTYMDWYQRTFATPETVLKDKKTDLEKTILDMFPLPEVSSKVPEHASSQSWQQSSTEAARALVAQVQTHALDYLAPVPEPSPVQHMTDLDVDSHNTANPASTPVHYPLFSSLADLEATTKTYRYSSDEKNPILYFHEKAAREACTDLKRLLRAVRQTERVLERVVEGRRREEYFATVGEHG